MNRTRSQIDTFPGEIERISHDDMVIMKDEFNTPFGYDNISV